MDPHGSLVSPLLGATPHSRTNDVILLNPAADQSRIISINILEAVRPEERHLVVSSVIKIIKNICPMNWGPRSEWLSQSSWTNHLMRAIVGQSRSSFNFRRLMDERRILLANLSKRALGDDVSSLLGSLIVTKLALASLSRENIPEEKRNLHVLYCDEVQNFTLGIDLPTILAESRKYALGLVVGTQTLAGLPEAMVKAIFGNCGTIASYRVSGEDAEALVREFGVSGAGVRTAEQMMDLVVPASELQNLPDYKMYVRTLIDGAPRDPERVQAFPPLLPFGHDQLQQQTCRERVTRTSLERFGHDRAQVEAELNRFL